MPGGLPKAVAAELRWRHARNRALAKAEDEKGRDLDARERAMIAARLLIERYPQARQPVEAALSEARTASDFKSLYRRISDEATETLRRWNEEMNAAKRESEPALP